MLASRTGGRRRHGPYGKANLALPDNHLFDLHPDTREEQVSDPNSISHAQVMPTYLWPRANPSISDRARKVIQNLISPVGDTEFLPGK
ncbi:hypothetical protein GCM10010519_06860 [Streptomyces lactacystinicus]